MDGLETAPERQRSPLEKAIDKAYDYHPYGFENVKVVDGWVAGPTFAVKTDEYEPIEREGIYKGDRHWYLKLTGILSGAKDAKEELEVKHTGHPRAEVVTIDKYGAQVTKSGGKCTCRALFLGKGAYAELCFPLYSLAKKLRVEKFKADVTRGSYVVYGYRGKELVAVFQAKGFDTCQPTTKNSGI